MNFFSSLFTQPKTNAEPDIRDTYSYNIMYNGENPTTSIQKKQPILSQYPNADPDIRNTYSDNITYNGENPKFFDENRRSFAVNTEKGYELEHLYNPENPKFFDENRGLFTENTTKMGNIDTVIKKLYEKIDELNRINNEINIITNNRKIDELSHNKQACPYVYYSCVEGGLFKNVFILFRKKISQNPTYFSFGVILQCRNNNNRNDKGELIVQELKIPNPRDKQIDVLEYLSYLSQISIKTKEIKVEGDGWFTGNTILKKSIYIVPIEDFIIIPIISASMTENMSKKTEENIDVLWQHQQIYSSNVSKIPYVYRKGGTSINRSKIGSRKKTKQKRKTKRNRTKIRRTYRSHRFYKRKP